MKRLTRADLQESIGRLQELLAKTREERDEAKAALVAAEQTADSLRQHLDSAKRAAVRDKQDLKHEIHTLELRFERARGYIDKVQDDQRVNSCHDRIVQPEIREPVEAHGPFYPTPPEYRGPDPRAVMERRVNRFHGTASDFEDEPRKPWWAR